MIRELSVLVWCGRSTERRPPTKNAVRRRANSCKVNKQTRPANHGGGSGTSVDAAAVARSGEGRAVLGPDSGRRRFHSTLEGDSLFPRPLTCVALGGDDR